ncbi:MAG: DUF3352 domain-containing protein [Synechococcus sp. BS307-5m-G39]|nr:DUF3352 domain-containing protein [Synechococcus sp. BS307-5m-G39]
MHEDDSDVLHRLSMKGRSFLLALVASAMVLLTLALGVWWAMAKQSPLRIVDRPLELSRAARFMPRDAELTLNWLVDPSRIPAYARAVAPVRQRQAVNESIRQLRDGAFALAGLNFNDELADWIGPQVSFAVLNDSSSTAGDQGGLGWVLALTSQDHDGARRFLQRFWQTRSLAGTDLQITRYRGMGLISGRGALLGLDPQPIATALIDDDLLLLASGRGALEQALDVSQLESLHLQGDEDLANDLKSLGSGVAFLTASPAAMKRWLGVPAAIADRGDLSGLVAGLVTHGMDLDLKALVHFRDEVIPEADGRSDAEALLADAGGDAQALALLSAPQALINPDSRNPLAQWIAPVLQRTLDSASAQGAAAVVALDSGPLLLQQGEAGWLLGTIADSPPSEAVSSKLEQDGLVGSTLDADGQSLEVWTRLVRQRRHGEESLTADLAVALEHDARLNWWGQTLEGLRQRRSGGDPSGLKQQLQELRSQAKAPSTQQLALAATPSRDGLAQWRPWILLQGLGGRSLSPAVQSLTLVAAPDQSSSQSGQASSLRLHARLRFG